MVYKKIYILIFVLFYVHTSFSDILYEKDELIITSIDVETYITLYEKNFGVSININNALKDLVLINNLIRNLEKNNKKFLDQIDEAIFLQNNNIAYYDLNEINFYRYSKIRSEFIIDYFKNNLVIKEIEYIFSKLNDLNLPVSKNDCLIIDKIIDLKNNKEFIVNFFNNLKINSSNFELFINEEKYRVCIDENKFRSIEQIIVDYIYNKTKEDFEYFVYGKTKN